MVAGLCIHIIFQGMTHFWPHPVLEVKDAATPVIAEVKKTERIAAARARQLGAAVPEEQEFVDRALIKIGNRETNGLEFRWVLKDQLKNSTYPRDAMVLERREWGNFYGFLHSIKENDKVVATDQAAWQELAARLERTKQLLHRIEEIERKAIGGINAKIERLRLKQRSLQLTGQLDSTRANAYEHEKGELEQQFQTLQVELSKLNEEIKRDSLVATVAGGQQVAIPLKNVVRVIRPNDMNLLQKLGFFCSKWWEFIADYPREANTEGGVFPAIYGTVLLVLIMTVVVTPFGVVAAVYLREYARQGPLTRLIRIAVNNLAGVPSIVYGVFGLGFFVYFLGGNIDRIFFPAALPSPTFGTPGLLWSALTLALLTVPVVIVATEEGLSRIPSAIREGSLALGATKAETLFRTIIPMAGPAIMTGMILAISRAAGEVAPLMLVGVVKLAPSLPLDGNFPFLHLDRKFMHLGFHIYDVGFQSPNVEAGRPVVYATALLLIVVVLGLNLTAIRVRNRLRESTKLLEN